MPTADSATGEAERPCTCPFRRYYIAFLLFFGYVLSYSTRVNLSVAILYMTEKKSRTVNGTESTLQEFTWNEEQQSYALSSFFYGYIVTQIPGGYLSDVIGGNNVLLIGIAGSGLLTFVAPYAAVHSFVALIVVRVGCGLIQGLTIPAANSIWAKWAPPYERTILSGIAVSGNFLSSLIVMPVCGVIGDQWGWEWMFYFFGILSCAWGILWFFTVSSSPGTDRLITESEKIYIQESIGYATEVKTVHPWRRIFASPAVWAVVVAHTGHNWGFYTVLLYGTKFFKETVGYTVRLSSMFTGSGFALCGVIIQIGSQVSDVLRSRKVLPTQAVRKLFTGTGFCLQSAFMLALAFVYRRDLVVAFVVLAIGLGGITWSGFYANPLDIAAPHAAIILGISNTFAALPGIISPYIIGRIIPDEGPTMKDWFWVWMNCAVAYLTANLVFLCLAKGERQSWVFTPQSD